MEGLWAEDYPCPFAPRQRREYTVGTILVAGIFHLNEDDVLKIGSSAQLKKMAWMGDALLDAMVSHVLWERMRGLEDASEGELTEQRKRYVCNRNLGIFLDNYMVPFCISGRQGGKEHAKGTLFEALLYKSWERGGDANVRHAVGQLMTWIDAHADECVEMNEVTIGWEAGKSTVLMVTWPDAEGPTEIKSIKDIEEQLPIYIARSERVYQQKRHEEEVILTGKGDLTEEQLKSIESAALHHTKDAVGVQWMSKKRNAYLDYFYPCCGLRKEGKGGYCGRVLWRDQDSIHPGDMKLGGSRKHGGGLAPRGTPYDYLPRGGIPHWTCCNKPSFVEGCVKSNPLS